MGITSIPLGLVLCTKVLHNVGGERGHEYNYTTHAELDFRFKMAVDSPELQTFTSNRDKFVLAIKHDLQATIDFCISVSIIRSSEVDYRFTDKGPDQKTRMLLSTLESKITIRPDIFRTFLGYLKSCPTHELFAREIGITSIVKSLCTIKINVI